MAVELPDLAMEPTIARPELTHPALGPDFLRRAMVIVTYQFFSALVTQTDVWTSWRCDQGLPVGARVVCVVDEPAAEQLILVFEHESFEPVPRGTQYPHVTPSFSRDYRQKEG